jgi:hypothetical protein
VGLSDVKVVGSLFAEKSGRSQIKAGRGQGVVAISTRPRLGSGFPVQDQDLQYRVIILKLGDRKIY